MRVCNHAIADPVDSDNNQPGDQIERETTTTIEPDSVIGVKRGSWSVILWTLRIVIAIQCMGAAGCYLFSSNESESDIFGILFFDLGWPEKLAQTTDDAGAYGCLVSALVLIAVGLFWPRGLEPQKWSQTRMVCAGLEYAALIFVAVWFFLLAAAHTARGGSFSEFAIGDHAVRFITPLTLLLLLRSFSAVSIRLARAAAMLLTFAVVATFASHGYVAQRLHGPFVDLILLTDMNCFHLGIEQSTAETLLKIIGWADILVGVLLLMTRWKVVAGYMIIWGLITASSRMTAFGIPAWPETLIRVANGGAPLVLLLLYRGLKPDSEKSTFRIPNV